MVTMAREGTDVSQALKHAGLDLDFYIHRSRSLEEVLPWGHIDNGMKRDLLVTQLEKSGVKKQQSAVSSQSASAKATADPPKP
jgi:hypothetical protein